MCAGYIFYDELFYQQKVSPSLEHTKKKAIPRKVKFFKYFIYKILKLFSKVMWVAKIFSKNKIILMAGGLVKTSCYWNCPFSNVFCVYYIKSHGLSLLQVNLLTSCFIS